MVFFIFMPKSNRTPCKKTVETLIRRRILHIEASDLGLPCLPIFPTKSMLCLYGLIKNGMLVHNVASDLTLH